MEKQKPKIVLPVERKVAVSTRNLDVTQMREGERRLVFNNGTLKEYIKTQGILFSNTWTRE